MWSLGCQSWLYSTCNTPSDQAASWDTLYLVPDVHLGQVLHSLHDLLGPWHRQTPVNEVVLHINDEEGPPGGEDTLQPLDGLTSVV